MNKPWVYPVPEYYARINAYIQEVGLPWAVDDCQGWEQEVDHLRDAMGDANERAVLDCCCGWGRQAVALAKLGWRVTACDVSASSLEIARRCARDACAEIDFQDCDMRALDQCCPQRFDWVVSCFGLYEIPDTAGVAQALRGMYAALKPGGSCYLRLRDMDFLLEEQPRHVFHGEKRWEHGRVICIEDWDFESEEAVVAIDAFLREDERRDPADHFRWQTETVGVRKKVLRKAELEQMLLAEGFGPVAILPRSAPWFPLEVVAVK